jgi:hypothetical protein
MHQLGFEERKNTIILQDDNMSQKDRSTGNIHPFLAFVYMEVNKLAPNHHIY